MATIPVGVRLDEGLVKRIDKIATETGVTRTEVVDRCVRIGLKQEEEFVELGPVAMELVGVLLSDAVRRPLEKLFGPADRKQLARFKHLREQRRGKRMDEAGMATE